MTGDLVAQRDKPRAARSLVASGGRALLEELAVARELLERAPLELPHAVARDVELVRDVSERRRLPAREAEAKLEDRPLERIEASERPRERRPIEPAQLCGGIAVGRRDEVAEGRATRPRRRADRGSRASGRPRAPGGACSSGILAASATSSSVGTRPSFPVSSRSARDALRSSSATWTGTRMTRDAVLNATLHRLPDPPRRVRRELEAAAPVELLRPRG